VEKPCAVLVVIVAVLFAQVAELIATAGEPML